MDDQTAVKGRAATLLALARHNGNLAATARETGVSEHRLARWRDEADQFTLDDLERVLLRHAAVLADDLLTGDAVDAPLNQRASALGMVVDRLLKLEAQREAADTSTTAGPDDDDGPARLVFRDRKGNLREWGDWEDWDDAEGS